MIMKVVDLVTLINESKSGKCSMTEQKFLTFIFECAFNTKRNETFSTTLTHDENSPNVMFLDGFEFFLSNARISISGLCEYKPLNMSSITVNVTKHRDADWFRRDPYNPITRLTSLNFDVWNKEEDRPLKKIVEETGELVADATRLSTAQGEEARLYARHMLYELADVIWMTAGYARRILNRWDEHFQEDDLFSIMMNKWIADETHAMRTPLLLDELCAYERKLLSRIRYVWPAPGPRLVRCASRVELASLFRDSDDKAIKCFNVINVLKDQLDHILDNIMPNMSYSVRDHYLIVTYDPDIADHLVWISTLETWLREVRGTKPTSYVYVNQNFTIHDEFGVLCAPYFKTLSLDHQQLAEKMRAENRSRTERYLADDDDRMSCCSEDFGAILKVISDYRGSINHAQFEFDWVLIDTSPAEAVSAIESALRDAGCSFMRMGPIDPDHEFVINCGSYYDDACRQNFVKAVEIRVDDAYARQCMPTTRVNIVLTNKIETDEGELL